MITAEEYTEEMVGECYWWSGVTRSGGISRMSKSCFINHLQEFGRIKYEEGVESLKINKLKTQIR